jgi:hypothetical protein
VARLLRVGRRALIALVLTVLTACSSPADSGHRAPSDGDPSDSAGRAADPTPNARASGTRTPRGGTVTADVVIARAGRPTAGASQGGHTFLLYLHNPSTPFAGEQSAAFRLVGPEGVADGLLTHRSGYWDFPRVTPYVGGFVVTASSDRRAWQVTAAGEARRLVFDHRPSELEEGDVLVEPAQVRSTGSGRAVSDNRAWVFRPEDGAVLTRTTTPSGAYLAHADGEGRMWALGRPESGQAVLFSALPGREWEKRVIGTFSDTFSGCACDTPPGPHGRDGVLVLAGNPLSHVSTDYGRTWLTYDLENTVPYREVLARDRYPQVSALADGRVVIGYSTVGYWVGRDPTNQSFERASRPREVEWASGLGDPLLFDGDRTSADGGRTWVTYRP